MLESAGRRSPKSWAMALDFWLRAGGATDRLPRARLTRICEDLKDFIDLASRMYGNAARYMEKGNVFRLGPAVGVIPIVPPKGDAKSMRPLLSPLTTKLQCATKSPSGFWERDTKAFLGANDDVSSISHTPFTSGSSTTISG
jgi:hypothetical protein